MDAMEQLVAGFAGQLEQARQIGQKLDLPPAGKELRRALVVGMGGSAFGAELARDLNAPVAGFGIDICRTYEVPAWVDAHTLAIVSSYSGNTEETLSAAESARAKGAQMAAITSGGRLEEMANEHGFPFVKIPGGYPPRSACGFSFAQQLYILRAYDLIPPFEEDLKTAIDLLNKFEGQSEANEIARRLHDRLPLIYAPAGAESLAIRLRQQINENANQLCVHHALPEMNHNELVGWEQPGWLLEKAVAVFVRWDYEHPRTRLRFDVTRQVLEEKGVPVVEIAGKGPSRMAQLLHALHLIDWISLYLADQNEVEATPVKVIDYLKAELAKR